MTARRLSGLDAAFLALETPTSTGHVGGLSILDPTTAPEPFDLDRLTRLLAQRIHRVPVLRQRLQLVPLGIDQPMWVDDEHFDLGYHVREIGLPRPGSDAQLSEQVARLHARPLDRSRPLWETYLISGLNGGRVAVYTKVHHAAMDGLAGADLLLVLYDLTPDTPDPGEPPPFDPTPAPSSVELGLRALGRVVWRPVEAAQLVTQAVRAVPTLGPMVAPVLAGLLGSEVGPPAADGGLLDAAPHLIAPRTPFNVEISPHRRYAFGSMPLPEIKEVKNAFGVTVNDVFMALCGGALRRWLAERDELPEDPLVAFVPVSVRTPGDHSMAGNRVSAMLAAAPTHLEDPVERLRATHHATMIAKSQQAVIPQGLIDGATDFAPPAFTSRIARLVFASRLMHRVPPFNFVVSNVPGPGFAVYMAGAKLLAYHPVSVVIDGVGLNITVIGYLDQLHFGLIAAREIVADLDELMTYLHEELAILLVAAREAEAAKPTRHRPARTEQLSARPARGTARKSAVRRPRSS